MWSDSEPPAFLWRHGRQSEFRLCLNERHGEVQPYGNAPFEKIGDAGKELFTKPAASAFGRDAEAPARPVAAMSY